MSNLAGGDNKQLWYSQKNHWLTPLPRGRSKFAALPDYLYIYALPVYLIVSYRHLRLVYLFY